MICMVYMMCVWYMCSLNWCGFGICVAFVVCVYGMCVVYMTWVFGVCMEYVLCVSYMCGICEVDVMCV